MHSIFHDTSGMLEREQDTANNLGYMYVRDGNTIHSLGCGIEVVTVRHLVGVFPGGIVCLAVVATHH